MYLHTKLPTDKVLYYRNQEVEIIKSYDLFHLVKIRIRELDQTITIDRGALSHELSTINIIEFRV